MGTRFAEPARRTFQDAQTLWFAGRLGTSDHLFGLAAECALKAILCGRGVISQDPPEKPYKVHVEKLWEEYTAALSGLPGSVVALGSNPFLNWKVDDRYSDDAAFTEARVAQHRVGAETSMKAFEEAAAQGVVA